MSPGAAEALRAMRANASMALRYARDRPDWRADSMVTDAIAKRVEEVAEAAKYRFPRALRGDYPQVAWDDIAGMRDRLVHDYLNVDREIVAEVLEEYLPALIAAIDSILGAEGI